MFSNCLSSRRLEFKLGEFTFLFFHYFMDFLFSDASIRIPMASLTVLFLMTGCASTVPIADVPTQPIGQSIQVKGKVVTVAPMINQSAYEIQDDRGSLWILSQKQPPKLETDVTVTGKVKFESIQVDGQELAERYLEEE